MALTPPAGSARLHEELGRYQNERKALVFTLTGGGTLEGVIRWFDDQAIHIVTPEREEVTLLRNALLYFRTQ